MNDQMESLSTLIHKRHEGDGWFVFNELADKPGFYSKRFADHAALGLWGSTGYEFHLYETKISREDVKREMRDPTKVDGVGKYAHYWWLVVSDEKIIADVLIPDAWGILVPVTRGGSRMLKVHRKAPKRKKPTAFDPMFCVAIIRNMGRNWVRPQKFRELEEKIHKLQHPDAPGDTAEAIEQLDYKHKFEQLDKAVTAFQEAAGVSMEYVTGGNAWRAGELGKAVKLALEIHGPHGDARLRDDIGQLVGAAVSFQGFAERAATLATQLRELMPGDVEVEHAPRCMLRNWGQGHKCECGAVMSEVERKISTHVSAEAERRAAQAPIVAAGNDDQGSGIDRRGPGEDVEDAGPVVRD